MQEGGSVLCKGKGREGWEGESCWGWDVTGGHLGVSQPWGWR